MNTTNSAAVKGWGPGLFEVGMKIRYPGTAQTDGHGRVRVYHSGCSHNEVGPAQTYTHYSPDWRLSTWLIWEFGYED